MDTVVRSVLDSYAHTQTASECAVYSPTWYSRPSGENTVTWWSKPALLPRDILLLSVSGGGEAINTRYTEYSLPHVATPRNYLYITYSYIEVVLNI